MAPMPEGTPGDAEIRKAARQAMLDMARIWVNGGTREDLQRGLDVWDAVHGDWTSSVGVREDGTVDVGQLSTLLLEMMTAGASLVISLLRSVEGWSGAASLDLLARFEQDLAAWDDAAGG